MLAKSYYHLKGLIPRSIQIKLRQILVRYQRVTCQDIWPIDPSTTNLQPPWDHWPDHKRFALVLTHDVETDTGLQRCPLLMKMEQELGFRSSFNFVPERYTTPSKIRQRIKSEGFEVGVHGLLHDGKLYNSKKIFMKRAARINEYIKAWDAVGFRSPSMHHNLEWLKELNILYDASTFDTDPFEPDNRGVGTIFPFWVPHPSGQGGFVELPYTLAQDSMLFLLLKEKTVDIWKKKLDWIAEQGGMALINTHPDYMNFSSAPCSINEYPSDLYRQFLDYVATKYPDQYYHPLPHEIAIFTTEQYRQSINRMTP